MTVEIVICPKCGSDKGRASVYYASLGLFVCPECETYWMPWQQERIAEIEAALKDAEDVISTIQFVHDCVATNHDVDAEIEIEALKYMANAYFKRKAEREGK